MNRRACSIWRSLNSLTQLLSTIAEPDKALLTKEETPELVSDSTFASKALYDVHAGRGDPGR